VVEHLPRKCEVWGLAPSMAKTKQNQTKSELTNKENQRRGTFGRHGSLKLTLKFLQEVMPPSVWERSGQVSGQPVGFMRMLTATLVEGFLCVIPLHRFHIYSFILSS
jgi:hypothetical protein